MHRSENMYFNRAVIFKTDFMSFDIFDGLRIYSACSYMKIFTSILSEFCESFCT